jgi:RNA polymerase sigma-70 factor (ECF subfamily)
MTTSKQQAHAELAARIAREQDRDAFVTLFDHFAPRINAYLQRLGLDAGAAEDMAQEVMAVLWRKAAQFDPEKSSLSTWLFRIARNRRIDAVRRDRSHLLDPEDPMLQPEAAPEAGGEIDARRRDERIRAAMQDLPAEQLELVRLAFFVGLTHTEIAEQTGLPLGTVKSRMRLAFTRLRRVLEGDPLMEVGD